MQTLFNVRGKQVAPAYFTVFYFKGGKKPVKKMGIVESIEDMNTMVEGAIKCEVYKNGTVHHSPELIDQFTNA